MPVPEALEHFHALRLVEIAVDRLGVVAVFLQRFRDDVDICLAVAEDDRVGAGRALAVDERAKQVALLGRRTVAARGFELHDALFDRLRRGRLAGDLDPGRRMQEGVGDPFDLGRHGSGEEQRLPGEGHEPEDPFDIGDEAHVEHPVGLVDDHDLHAGQEQLAALEMVEQPAWRSDQHVDAAVDQRILFLEAHAADQERLGQLHVLGIGVEVFRHLGGQLARRAEHQRTRHPRPGTAARQHADHRQGERRGLAGAGLGDAEHVLAFERRGDRPRLDRCRRLVARLFDGFEDFGAQVQIGKSSQVGPFAGGCGSGLAADLARPVRPDCRNV